MEEPSYQESEYEAAYGVAGVLRYVRRELDESAEEPLELSVTCENTGNAPGPARYRRAVRLAAVPDGAARVLTLVLLPGARRIVVLGLDGMRGQRALGTGRAGRAVRPSTGGPRVLRLSGTIDLLLMGLRLVNRARRRSTVPRRGLALADILPRRPLARRTRTVRQYCNESLFSVLKKRLSVPRAIGTVCGIARDIYILFFFF